MPALANRKRMFRNRGHENPTTGAIQFKATAPWQLRKVDDLLNHGRCNDCLGHPTAHQVQARRQALERGIVEDALRVIEHEREILNPLAHLFTHKRLEFCRRPGRNRDKHEARPALELDAVFFSVGPRQGVSHSSPSSSRRAVPSTISRLRRSISALISSVGRSSSTRIAFRVTAPE